MRKRGKKSAPRTSPALAPELEVTRLLQQGEVQQALQMATRALAQGRRNPDLSNIAGICAATYGDDTLATQLWLHALELNPRYAQAWFNLGVVHQKKGLHVEAEQAFRNAVENDPSNTEAWLMLGDLLYGQGRLIDAKAAYELLLARDAANAHAHNNLGLICASEKQQEEALAHYQKAILLAPDSPEILSNYANLLSSMRREHEAESLLQKALELAPDSAINYTNLGVLNANLGKLSEAERCFNQALKISPEYPLARLNLSYAQLKQGNFHSGWANHEARYDPRLPDNGIPLPVVAAPQWQGESLDGKHLLVWMEQGYGDQIQFSRYLAQLKQRWNVLITLVCRPSLTRLLETLGSADLVYSPDEAPAEGYDFWTLSLSLPLHCATRNEQEIPAQLPYLKVPQASLDKWHDVLSGDGYKVGLAWQGNPKHLNDAWRSLPEALLAPLLDVPEITYVSLQPGGAFPGLVALDHPLEDFSDTAALISQLDLVISADTAVAHLAGAMAKPCWLMLPHYRTDWRWLVDHEDSPWYPGVMRLFRQDADERWEPVVARVCMALRQIKSGIP